MHFSDKKKTKVQAISLYKIWVQPVYQQLHRQTVHSGLDPYPLSILASIHTHKPDRIIRTKSRTLTSLSMNSTPSHSYRRCGTHTTGTNLNPFIGAGKYSSAMLQRTKPYLRVTTPSKWILERVVPENQREILHPPHVMSLLHPSHRLTRR